MKKGIFFPVGQLFQFGKKHMVVEATEDNQPTCAGCWFSNSYRRSHKLTCISCCTHRLDCSAFSRKDHTHVIFKSI